MISSDDSESWKLSFKLSVPSTTHE